MLKNYIKIAWRSLFANKSFSLINIFGLTLGMTSAIVITLWVMGEIKTNKFHEKDDRIYQVFENQSYPESISTYPFTPGILAKNIVEEFPEIEKASQLIWFEEPLFNVGEVTEREQGYSVQGDYLSIFSFPLLQGNAESALSEPNTIVISEEMAAKFFPNENPLGKSIKVDGNDVVKVTGILENLPTNTSEEFSYLINYERWYDQNNWAHEWENNGPKCYLLLAENADTKKVNAKIAGYIKEKNPDSNVDIFIQKYSDAYLYSSWRNGVQDGGRIDNVRIFSLIAIFILLIACVNFMNLATARSVRRGKEIGIRKAVGSSKRHIVGQLLGESVLITLIALFFASLLTAIFLPNFNAIVDRNLAVDLFDPLLVGVIIGFTLLVGIVSGLYPALFMSSFRPISVLTGSLKTKSQTQFVRKGLVVFQFCLSIALILGMLVIYQQRDYIMNKNLGFDKENLIYLPIEGELQDNFESFKQVLQNAPGIETVGASNATPLASGGATQGISWTGKDTTETVLFSHTPITYDYLKTMGIAMAKGRNFDASYGADSANFLINETAAKKMGFEDPIGEQIDLMGQSGQIVGVVKDYHVSSLRNPISPVVLWLYPSQSYWGHVIVRTQAGQTKQAIASIGASFEKFNPEYPLQYKFADEEYAQIYKTEQLIGTLANYFAALVIFISCLGLFGLSAFMAEQRTKEIGIRKVLGANVKGLILLLSKEYIYLILIASVIALPTTNYFLKDWLAGFEFRISIGWWYFALSALAAAIIALVTVGYQAALAATANPVKSLKNQ